MGHVLLGSLSRTSKWREVAAVGDRVYAIGNPHGLTNTLSDGLVSGVRKSGGLDFIQTNAAISPGSSGGPLLDENGRVVGVTKAYIEEGQNLNLAVPAASVRSLLDKAATNKPVTLSSASGLPLLPESSTELARAEKELDNGNIDDALRILKKLSESEPKNPAIWERLGFAALVRTAGHPELIHESFELALRAYTKWVELKPDSADANYNLGATYRNLGSYDEAVAALEKAIRLAPESPDPYFALGTTYKMMHLREKSIACYKTVIPLLKAAIRLNPKDPDLYDDLGVAYVNIGSRNEALEAYNNLKNIAKLLQSDEAKMANIQASMLLDEIRKMDPKSR